MVSSGFAFAVVLSSRARACTFDAGAFAPKFNDFLRGLYKVVSNVVLKLFDGLFWDLGTLENHLGLEFIVVKVGPNVFDHESDHHLQNFLCIPTLREQSLTLLRRSQNLRTP